MAKRKPAPPPAAAGRTVRAVVECATPSSFRTEKVRGMFDLQPAPVARREWSVELPADDEPWEIGLIVGPSGSGKSTIAREAFGGLYTPPPWDDSPVIDGFPDGCTVEQIVETLTAVGFASPPSWLKPYGVLSNGEKFRCDLARALLGEAGKQGRVIVFDEFTSLVDRTVAQIGSAALAKTIRRRNQAGEPLRFVAVTCHYDIADWLECDWVLDMAGPALARGRLRRPAIELEIAAAPRSSWGLFAPHHYLSHSLPACATHYIAWAQGQPAATCILTGNFGRAQVDRAKFDGIRNISRLVTLPDYQGVGIAGSLLDTVAADLAARRLQAKIVTSHPGLRARLHRSPLWRVTAAKMDKRHKRTKKAADSRGISCGSLRTAGLRYYLSARYIGPAEQN